MPTITGQCFIGGARSDEALCVRWFGADFFFSFELSYLRVSQKPRLAGASEAGDQLQQKPLALSCAPRYCCPE